MGALVVHGMEGLDELSIAGASKVWELKDGEIKEHEVTPATFGVQAHSLEEVRGGKPDENAKELKELLAGRGRTAVRDMITMNAGAALYVCGKAVGFKQGVEMAREAISSGRAVEVVDLYVKATQL